MRFSILVFFVLLLLVQDAICSFNQHIELSHFKRKLKDRTRLPNSMSKSSSSSQSSPTKRLRPEDGAKQVMEQKERVLYPEDYGADPSGEEDSSEAIMKAVREAYEMDEGGLELLPGIRDLGGVVIDLHGGNYKISEPITFPSAAGNILVKGGTLRASDTFPTDRHLVELWSSNSPKLQKTEPSRYEFNNSSKFQQPIGIYYEDITFRDILFDSGYRGGGLFVADSARIRINNCFFLHFTTEGILVQGGHETFVSNSFLGQHSTVGRDKGEREFSGTAIDLASNDNAVTDVAIFSAAIGIVLRGQANIITGVHCYNKATGFGGIGILVKLAGNSKTRIDNCYMDYTSIVMEDPFQVHVTNGFFLGDANIVLKSIKGQISGLNIVDNMFSGNIKNKVPIVSLDGEFSEIDQVVADRNSVDGMVLRSTVGKLSVGGDNTIRRSWVGDFSNVLLFPDRIRFFQYSFYSLGDLKFVANSVRNVSNNVVVVESDQPVDGVVSFFVEQ